MTNALGEEKNNIGMVYDFFCGSVRVTSIWEEEKLKCHYNL